MPFGYLNQNNPISIGDIEAQEMVNVSIDKDFLEYNRFDSTRKNQDDGRFLYLPNGKEVIIGAEAPNAGMVVWRNRGSNDDYVPFYVLWQSDMYPSMTLIGIDAYVDEIHPTHFVDPVTGNVFNYTDGENERFRYNLRHRSFFRPSAPGEVFYAVTIYDTVENIESAPFYSNNDYDGIVSNHVVYEQDNIDNEDIVRITLKIPSNNTYDVNRYEYRIYRMPLGGTEYLLVKKVSFADINIYPPDQFGNHIYKFIDEVTEDRIGTGSIMTTEHLVYEPLQSQMNVMALYADKLFIGGQVLVEETNKNKGILYFSATSEYWKFNASFFFSFVDPVIGLTTFNEMLVVQTTKKLFIIYGDSEDNFVQKEIDFQFDGIAYNSGQSLSSFAYFLANPKDSEDNTEVNRVFAFDGSTVTDISQKIIKEFNFRFAETYVLDNRYFVIEQKDGRKLILDTLKIGWCISNPMQKYFAYRTKEFNVGINGNNFLKQIYIRAKGAFIVFVIGDNNKIITQRRFCSEKPDNHFCYVRPRRFTNFSIRFVGYEDTEIYDWGVVE